MSSVCRTCLWNCTSIKSQLYMEDLFDFNTNTFYSATTIDKKCATCGHWTTSNSRNSREYYLKQFSILRHSNNFFAKITYEQFLFYFGSRKFKCHRLHQDVEHVYGVVSISSVNYTWRICSTSVRTNSIKQLRTKIYAQVAVISSLCILSILVSRIEKEENG